MSQVITDVIIGVIILSMLLVVIPVYRNQSNQMAMVVGMTDQNEKIGEVMFSDMPGENDVVSGRYIRELLFYYVINEIDFTVTIEKSGVTNMITENTYADISSIMNEEYMFFKITKVDKVTHNFHIEHVDTMTVVDT